MAPSHHRHKTFHFYKVPDFFYTPFFFFRFQYKVPAVPPDAASRSAYSARLDTSPVLVLLALRLVVVRLVVFRTTRVCGLYMPASQVGSWVSSFR